MTLSAELEQVFWQEVKAYEEAQQMPYISSIERLGMQKGLEQGRQEGRQELLMTLLESRFGEADRALLDLIPHLLQLPNREATQLILSRSREELIAHFISHSFLTDVNLRRAKLYGAKLTDADLTGVDLTCAVLQGASLSAAIGANLAGAII